MREVYNSVLGRKKMLSEGKSAGKYMLLYLGRKKMLSEGKSAGKYMLLYLGRKKMLSEGKSAGKYMLLYLGRKKMLTEGKSAGKYMLLPLSIILGSAGLRPAEKNTFKIVSSSNLRAIIDGFPRDLMSLRAFFGPLLQVTILRDHTINIVS